MNIRAIKIDTATQTAYFIQLPAGDSLAELYRHINCGTVAHFQITAMYGCYVDDEGLYNQHPGCWSLPGFAQTIAGNAIVCGTDGEGDSAGVDLEFLPWLLARLRFHGPEAAPEPFMAFIPS